MSDMNPSPPETAASRMQPHFFAQNSRIVAQQLLGKILVHNFNGVRLAGKIVETEAYCDFHQVDLACHASKNNGRPTKRTGILFGEAGYAYVYLNYGIHWLFNVVTGATGKPGAVLIRALEPIDGFSQMGQNRNNRPQIEWSNGPGKLSQAMGINQSHNKQNLCRPSSVIWIEERPLIDRSQVANGARIGLGKTPEPWRSMPWRYWIKNNKYVSAKS